MARFDPNTYPDRLAFEANARRIRAEEIGKAICGVVAWLQGWQRESSGQLHQLVADHSTDSRGRLMH